MTRFEEMREILMRDGLSRDFATKAAMQQVVLLGLADGGFFRHAAFYGGTCLRLMHGLDRFSEDLDFTMLVEEPGFSLTRQFAAIERAFAAVGKDVEVELVGKSKWTATESAFVKGDTEVYLIGARNTPKTRVKFEMDTKPPITFPTESKVLLLPSPRQIVCCTLEGLAVGKTHALLFRAWKNRVKGRDWFDFQWLVSRNVPLSLSLVRSATATAHPEAAEQMNNAEGLRGLLHEKADTIDYNMAKADVLPFYPGEATDLEIWSAGFFHEVIKRLRIIP